MKLVSRFLLAPVVLTVCLLASSCKKQETPSVPAKAAPQAGVSIDADPAAASAPAPGAAAAPTVTPGEDPGPAPVTPKSGAMMTISPNATPEANTKMLTDALNVFEDWYGGKSPANLHQLVEKKIIDQVPLPPQGMKFVIDARKHVVLLQNE